MIETRHIRYFEAVASRLSFTKAAEDEHITQAALSEQIGRLERFVGARLFERTTRRVTLTRAGIAFRDSVSGVLDTIDAAASAARDAAAGKTGTLTVGFQWNTYPWIALARRTFEWEHPGVRVVYRQSAFGDPTAGLDDVDVAFVTPPFEGDDRCSLTVLARDERIAIVGSTHPWSERKQVNLEEALCEPLVTLATLDGRCRAFWELDRERGKPVQASDPEPATIDEWIAEIEQGAAIAVAPSVAWTTYARPTLRRVEVRSIAPATTAIATRLPNDPLVAAFIDIATRLAAAPIAAGPPTP